ncbi:MAG: xanthine dehydrogenase family protein subunit M, partial [Lautropia sp.]
DYIKPETLPEVFELLARHGEDARILAGGQTLMATLNMRLSEPAVLIDISGLSELKGITLQDSTPQAGMSQAGMLRIGALVTHTEIEQSDLVARHAPLISEAAPHIGHRAIRNLGTFGGSIAFADPAAEWPACALALEGSIVLRSARGERRVPATEFFEGLYTTRAEPGEIVAACEFAADGPGRRHDFSELARRHGDYAIAGLAAGATRIDSAGGAGKSDVRLADVRLAFFALADRPVRARRAEAILAGAEINQGTLDAAAKCLTEEIDVLADLTNSREAKQHLARVLMRRAIKRMCA